MKTIIITGASSGIGACAAAQLASSGHRIAVVGRNHERTDAVATAVGGTPFYADYDRLDDVRELAARLLAEYRDIDVLINNAGGLVSPRALSADGNERTFQHNHLAPFLLTALLRERLEASRGRVIGVASFANRAGHVKLDDLQWQSRPWFGGWRAYGTSKLETIMFARELARRSSLDSYAVHPGYVATAFGRDSPLVRLSTRMREGGFGISASEGALPLVRLATDDEIPGENGGYFDRLRAHGRTARQANDAELAAALWERSTELLAM